MDQERLLAARRSAGTWGRLVKARLELALRFGGSSVLDIGCSSGSYVAELSRRGIRAAGCDLLADPAWSLCSGSPFFAADGAALPFGDRTFESIVAFEVLEHQTAPEQMLAEVRRVAKERFILSVPNCAEPIIFREAGLAYHHWTDRTHQQFFSLEGLRLLLEENGFTLEEHSFCNPIAVDKLFLATWHVPERIAALAGELTKRIPFRKKYFMTILAVAKKR